MCWPAKSWLCLGLSTRRRSTCTSCSKQGGNDPDARTAVLDTVERLVKDGLLEERGNDFYALTQEGRVNVRLDHKD
jgi:hypothetical protein